MNIAGHLIDNGGIQPFQHGDALTQGSLKVQLPAHGPGRYCGNLVLLSGMGGQHLDDLAFNQRRIAVEAHQTLGTPTQARGFNGDIDADLLRQLR